MTDLASSQNVEPTTSASFDEDWIAALLEDMGSKNAAVREEAINRANKADPKIVSVFMDYAVHYTSPKQIKRIRNQNGCIFVTFYLLYFGIVHTLKLQSKLDWAVVLA